MRPQEKTSAAFYFKSIFSLVRIIKFNRLNKMSEYIKTSLTITWLIVGSYWFISGLLTKKVEIQEPFLKRFILYWLPLILAFILLGPGDWYGRSWLREKFVEHTNIVGTTGLLFCIAGAVIAVWSRYLIGRNWSLSVQRKIEHELIQKGMYKIIRHPIYFGFLLLFIGNGIIVGDYRAIIAVFIVFISLWFKLKKEEKLLLQAFGDDYLNYKLKTKALIPFLF
jgi:protein-S-isoprenylcysteine O-methyltransferase Ste14